MSLRLKIYATILIACLIGALFFYFNEQTQRQTVGRLTLISTISDLETLEKELNGEVLQSSFFLYHDYDRIHTVIAKIEKKVAEIERRYRAVNPGRHQRAVVLLDEYKAAFATKKRAIERFQTANSTIKNSTMYIPILTRKYADVFHHGKNGRYHHLLASIASSIYLAKNSLDRDLVTTLEQSLATLRQYAFADPAAQRFHETFVAHTQVFVANFPRYTQSLGAVLAARTEEALNNLRHHITEEDKEWLLRLNLLSYTFFAAFLASVGLVIVLLVKTERENITLVRLQEALTAAATTDRLTQLANRFAFDTDLGQLQNPVLFLINVDSFKHINDLYGVRAGDYVLAGIAAILNDMLPDQTWGRVYRLGGDDFGILIEEKSSFNRDLMAQSLIEAVENEGFIYRDQDISVTISIGLSAKLPLLETADMALKEVKKQSRLKYLIYSDELNIQETIARNLKTLDTIHHALEADGILVYYQPIVDNVTGEADKYECLIRLRDRQGTILTPFAFLGTAKESPLYPALTREVIDKSFAAFAANDYGFSINLSVADILDHEVHRYIVEKLDSHPDIARRLTFEILENEGVENYEAVRSFITRVKAMGCKIAIDDFGAGYSNFAHILRLEVDTIKIDASLIRHIDTDANAQVLVRTIVDFCRQLGILTVAEFVHSAEVHAVVRQLGIDFSQGFFLGKPSPSLDYPQQ